MLCKECCHILRFNPVVIVVGGKSTQGEEPTVRDSTFAVVRMSRREMEVVVSICFLVKDRCLNLIIRICQLKTRNGSSVPVIVDVNRSAGSAVHI